MNTKTIFNDVKPSTVRYSGKKVAEQYRTVQKQIFFGLQSMDEITIGEDEQIISDESLIKKSFADELLIDACDDNKYMSNASIEDSIINSIECYNEDDFEQNVNSIISYNNENMVSYKIPNILVNIKSISLIDIMRSILKFSSVDFQDRNSFTTFIISLFITIFKYTKFEFNDEQTEILRFFIKQSSPFKPVEKQLVLSEMENLKYNSNKTRSSINQLLKYHVLEEIEKNGVVFYCLKEKVLLRK